jgi:hypothetical protein
MSTARRALMRAQAVLNPGNGFLKALRPEGSQGHRGDARHDPGRAQRRAPYLAQPKANPEARARPRAVTFQFSTMQQKERRDCARRPEAISTICTAILAHRDAVGKPTVPRHWGAGGTSTWALVPETAIKILISISPI